MPNNPLVDAFQYLFSGSPQQGPGLFSPQNIGNALRQTGGDIQTIMTPTRTMPTVDVTATRLPQTPTPNIDVGALRQQFVQNMGAQQMAGTQPPQQARPGGGIDWQMLMDIGIPALSAIVGTAAPGTLAGAAGLSTGYTGAREKQREQERELEKLKTKREYEVTELTPSERNYKRKQQKDFSEAYAQNRSNRRFIAEARPLVDKLPTGLGGAVSMASKKMFDPDSPVLGDWQRVKAILTDTTLLQSMKTKGAISDREMEEFKQAAANDSLISKPRILAAFDRYEQILNSEDEGKIDAFYQAFGEDPRGKQFSEDRNISQGTGDYSNLSDEELDTMIMELEGR